MKKMMVALVAVAFAAVAQAAAFNWTSSGTNASKTFYGSDTQTTIAGTMVYLFDAAVVSQNDIITGLRDNKTIGDFTSVKSQTLDANSRLTATEFSYGEAGPVYSYFMAIVQDDFVFVSNSVSAQGQSSATASVTFSGIKTQTQNNLGTADYSTAGWYQTVPEPTSGLLMLLGMAGLALRRRRA